MQSGLRKKSRSKSAEKILFNLGGLLGERLRKTNALLVKEQTKK